MSWDIFVQDIPKDAKTAGDIPDTFEPQPIGSLEHAMDVIRSVVPFADYSDPTWITVDSPHACMEISIGPEDPLESFAFFIRGGDHASTIVTEILDRLQLRAFDTASESGIFDPLKAEESFLRWKRYRDQCINPLN